MNQGFDNTDTIIKSTNRDLETDTKCDLFAWFASLFQPLGVDDTDSDSEFDTATGRVLKPGPDKEMMDEHNDDDEQTPVSRSPVPDPLILKKYLDELYDLTFISPEKKNISFVYDHDSRDLYIEYIGYKGTDYYQGQYFIHLNLPDDYPLSPPKIRVLTESGRFYPGSYLSLSISHYHKESWIPLNLEFLVLNVISAFTDELGGIGHIRASSDERKSYAEKSRRYNEVHYPELCEKFDLINKEKMAIAQISKEELVKYVDTLKKSCN